MTGADPNVIEPSSWERELGSARGTRVGAAAGAVELGCTLYELDPHSQAVPYHLHHGNEELLIVLEGRLELRTPQATRELPAGAVVSFPAGAGGAHRVRNFSDARARYLVVSTMRFPDLAEQLDTGTVLALKGPGDGWAFPAGRAGDYVKLTEEALAADAAHPRD
ncbi:MAG: cupin domain-containing protein [Solirubrobacterales bacterium]|nr:cupin domain-containing protein [Solirubrobacterales bacterium]